MTEENTTPEAPETPAVAAPDPVAAPRAAEALKALISQEKASRDAHQAAQEQQSAIAQSRAMQETMAAFHNKFVGFTKFGTRRVPRAWKCLIAWRKRLPTRSRTPTSWHVIVALIVRLVARGHFHPGVFLTLMRATWCRLRVLMTLSVGAARVAQVNPLSAAQRCRLRELSDCLVRGIMLCDALPPRLPW